MSLSQLLNFGNNQSSGSGFQVPRNTSPSSFDMVGEFGSGLGLNFGGGNQGMSLANTDISGAMPKINAMEQNVLKSITGGGGKSPDWYSNLPEWMQGMIGTKDNPGWGGLAVGAASSLGNMYMGAQQLGLAKDAQSEARRQFDLNYGNQRQTMNTQLQDRQQARVNANPNAYQSVSAYMDQNGIK